MISVPRIYEKMFARIQATVDAAPAFQKRLFRWAVQTGRKVARLRADKLRVPPWLAIQYQFASKLVLSKVYGKIGGRLRWAISGGAPLNRELCEFLHACGIKVLEGYGLTETTAALAYNRPHDYAFGTVGRPLNGVEIRIENDGEILVRGPIVFKEYYKNPQATREAFTSDGWFQPGMSANSMDGGI